VEEAVGTEPIAHRVGESGQLDAIGAHHPDAAKLEFLREVEDGASLHQRGKGSVRRQRGRVLERTFATHVAENLRPMMRSPASVWSR
jgi:hypothetical protein